MVQSAEDGQSRRRNEETQHCGAIQVLNAIEGTSEPPRGEMPTRQDWMLAQGYINGREVRTLVDTRAIHSFLMEKEAQ